MRFSPAALAALLLLAVSPAFALDGQIGSHDPSTVAVCDGKYYVYSTGNGIPISVSDDGWTWRRAGNVLSTLPDGRIPETVRKLSPKNNGTNVWAPDIIKVNNQYLLYYSVSSWGDFASAVGLLTNKTLDPNSPDYKWVDGGPVAWSDGVENLNAIDPGVFLDPNDGKLWMAYGSYHGTIRLVELDPKTGKRLHEPQSQHIIANRSESAIMLFRDGWYYLITNHGSCCQGTSSAYNLRVGRAKTIQGPFLDDYGTDMARGGGKLFLSAGDRKIGPGHFGLLDLGDGVQKFSCHYEADLDRPGPSVFDIRPLLWQDGWPVAGDNLRAGDYQVMAKRTGTVLELAVQGVPVPGGRGRGGAGGGRGRGGRGGAATNPATAPSTAPSALPGVASATALGQALATAPATLPQIAQETRPAPNPAAAWPDGPIDLRLASYLLQAQQKWTLTPVPNAGGTPGAPFFRLSITGTDRTLEVGANNTLRAAPAFTRDDTQLWRLDQLADGSYRIQPKLAKEKLALTLSERTVTLAPFSPQNESQKWLLKPQ